ncbi:C40 family peptidase [uncultured Clostridium sp.]|uniref:C40 family peptidase n=1 Tax=uncultured Clostridium sp. TaxID=59620 RepID=UPI00261EE6C1|nr:C40 family peptidase [uncultured Clostridium sp.]
MKRKIVAAIIAGTLSLNVALPTMTASAEPISKEARDAQDQYDEMQANIAKINDKINGFNTKIEPLVINIQNNKEEINNLKKQMENTEQEIAQTKVKIANQEEVLGNRLSDLYKSGGQLSYLELVFGASSFGDLIDRVEIATRLVTTDRNAVEALKNDKDNLDKQIKSIQEKTQKVEQLNTETEKELADAEKLKAEQETLAKDAEVAQKEFDQKYLARYEREIVSSQINILNSSSSSIEALKGAISQITDLKNNQIKSPTVKAEIDSAISKGQTLLKQKQDEQARAQAEAEAEANANRGNTNTNNSSNNNNTNNNNNNSNNNNNGNNNSNSGNNNNGGGTVTPPPAGNTATVQAVLNEAYKHLGKPYVWGATGPDSFDCSGFTSYVYRKAAGREIGRTTYNQVGAGRAVSRSQLQPGDLVFTSAGHVGIYVGNGNMIHAPSSGDKLKVSPVWAFYAGRRIL